MTEENRPDILFINCIDPCGNADLVFDGELKDQLVCSQMGAIVAPHDARGSSEMGASLSYAIEIQKVSHVIVMGHSHCESLAALIDEEAKPLSRYMSSWAKISAKAQQAAKRKTSVANDSNALNDETERQAVIMSLKNLMEYPLVNKAVDEGRLTVNGWFFDAKNGALFEYEPKTDTFKWLDTPSAQRKSGTRLDIA